METFFPWRSFQLWLREGICAGNILNKLMVVSLPESERSHKFGLDIHPEELELLRNVAERERIKSYRHAAKDLLGSLSENGKSYPRVTDKQARTLWLALNHYATSSPHYPDLRAGLNSYISSADDPEVAIPRLLDGFWRSIGPAMDPDRTVIEKSPH